MDKKLTIRFGLFRLKTKICITHTCDEKTSNEIEELTPSPTINKLTGMRSIWTTSEIFMMTI